MNGQSSPWASLCHVILMTSLSSQRILNTTRSISCMCLRTSQESGLTLRRAKCHANWDEGGSIFRPCILSNCMVWSLMQTKLQQYILDWPHSKDVSEVRQFIGLASYYRRYVKGFGDIATPLHQLTEKTSQFLWTQGCQTAFEVLKKSLTQAPVLCYPSFDKTFRCKCCGNRSGARARRIGSCVCQSEPDTTRKAI